MVFKLLVLRGRGPEHGASGLEQIRPLHVEAAVDEEVLLLRAERHRDASVRLAKVCHEAAERLLERLHGAEERRLRVKRLAAVRAERGGDAERRAVRVALDERGTRGVPRRVAARLKGGTEAARREAGGVRLAADQVLAAERLHGLRGAARLHEAVVLLGGAAREGLEPVGEVRGALRERPVLHRVRHVVRDGRVEGLALVDRGEELRGGGLRQEGADFLLAEHVLAVRRHGRIGRQGGGRRVRHPFGDRVDRMYAVILAHGVGIIPYFYVLIHLAANATNWKRRCRHFCVQHQRARVFTAAEMSCASSVRMRAISAATSAAGASPHVAT